MSTEIERQVRELVRRRGVDPMGDPAAVGVLIDEVLAVTGPPTEHDRATRRTVLDAVAGLGPLQRFLDDPSVEEIWVNGPGRVFVARGGRSELTTAILAPGQIEELVQRALERSGRRVDLSTPFVDAVLDDGSRLHVVIPDVTREHWAVNIRKFVARAHSLPELVTLGTVTPQAARFLEATIAAGLNVIVSGGTQAGKTTMLNCLAGAIPAGERVISCEEVFELQLRHHPDWVALQTRQPNLEGTGEIPLRRLVTEALRMRPDRLIVGEVRQAEALDLLLALNAGIPGLCSVHANSARQAVTKLCTLPLLAGVNVHPSFVVPTVATCVDLVVHLELTAHGERRVREVVAVGGRGGDGAVGGRGGDGAVETAEIFATVAEGLVRADGFPPHGERYARAGVDLPALLVPRPELRA